VAGLMRVPRGELVIFRRGLFLESQLNGA
jgi:hypothetical protein